MLRLDEENVAHRLRRYVRMLCYIPFSVPSGLVPDVKSIPTATGTNRLIGTGTCGSDSLSEIVRTGDA